MTTSAEHLDVVNKELALFDPTMAIEDPSDQRLVDSIMLRPRERVSPNHILFLRALIERGGKKFQNVKPTTAPS